MTKTELANRLATMTPELIAKVRTLLNEGYGTAGIRFESGASIKQINAVAKQQEATYTKYSKE
jgi:hypothetical protein